MKKNRPSVVELIKAVSAIASNQINNFLSRPDRPNI